MLLRPYGAVCRCCEPAGTAPGAAAGFRRSPKFDLKYFRCGNIRVKDYGRAATAATHKTGDNTRRPEAALAAFAEYQKPTARISTAAPRGAARERHRARPTAH